MNVEVVLPNATLKAQDVNDRQVNKIIEGFFDNISLNKKVVNAAEETFKKVEAHQMAIPVKPLLLKKPTPLPKQEQGDSRHRALELIGSNKNMTQQPFSALGLLLEKPPETIGAHTVKWIDEGVKENEKGEKLYRTHYWCSCGNSGKRYIPTYYKTCKCHQCDTHLVIEEAVPGEELERDENGAFFIARELYESEGEV